MLSLARGEEGEERDSTLFRPAHAVRHTHCPVVQTTSSRRKKLGGKALGRDSLARASVVSVRMWPGQECDASLHFCEHSRLYSHLPLGVYIQRPLSDLTTAVNADGDAIGRQSHAPRLWRHLHSSGRVSRAKKPDGEIKYRGRNTRWLVRQASGERRMHRQMGGAKERISRHFHSTSDA